jgi:hypothetical protein
MEIKNYTNGMKYIKSVIQPQDFDIRFNNDIIEMLLLFHGEQNIEYLVIKKCSQYKNKLLFFKTENGNEKQMYYNDILREYFGLKDKKKRPNGFLLFNFKID